MMGGWARTQVSDIKSLFVTDTVKRLTAEQVLFKVESIILVLWNIAPDDKAGTLQVLIRQIGK